MGMEEIKVSYITDRNGRVFPNSYRKSNKRFQGTIIKGIIDGEHFGGSGFKVSSLKMVTP